ncbi:RAD55 family ATPase [Methanobacterium sp.]|uniref:RAD55 family ATPase n=1 Tax=Methanobacterium sp. TaxID=2164 RepID=UPI003C7408E2
MLQNNEIIRIESGIPGFDELTYDEETNLGGIPENSATLIYGPPKTGKSIFGYQFMYRGLLNEVPCLYLLTDYTINQLQQNTMNLELYVLPHIHKELLYVIDAISNLSGNKKSDTNTFKLSSVHNPTDLMVKVGLGTRFVFSKSHEFRSVFDSLTTSFAFNPDRLVIRVLKAYIKRVKEAGGTAIILYTEGAASSETENMLKESVDNIIKLDGNYATVEKMIGIGKRRAHYEITNNGIKIGKRDTIE